MNSGELTAKLKEFVIDQGADLVGITLVDRFVQAPDGHRLEEYLPGARPVVVITIRLLDSIMDALPQSRPRLLTADAKHRALRKVKGLESRVVWRLYLDG